MTETELQREIQLALSGPDIRMFRNSVGEAYVGQAIRQPNGDVLLKHPRRISFGLAEGSSDLIGLRSLVIGPEHVGRRLAVFSAIEVKKPRGRRTPAQRSFVTAITELGGLAGFAESVAEARIILQLGVDKR